MRLYAVQVRMLEARFDEHMRALSPVRQQEILESAQLADRLRRLGAGLLLARNLGSTDIVRDAFGKPSIANAACFSIAHSGDWAVLATDERNIGVDVERIRPMRTDAFARRWFTPDERADCLNATDPNARFFQIWCMKESAMKCDGRGLGMDPASFSVLASPYVFETFDAIEGYALAVCAETAFHAVCEIQTF